MPKSVAVRLTIRNERYHYWPALAICLAIAAVLFAMACYLLELVSGNVSFFLLVGSGSLVIVMMMAFAVAASLGVAQRWVPYWIKAVRLGELLETFPGGLRYRPSSIIQIAFGPDPNEDYAEVSGQVRMCQASFIIHGASPFQLIVSRVDARRLRDWATEKGIAVRNPGRQSGPQS